MYKYIYMAHAATRCNMLQQTRCNEHAATLCNTRTRSRHLIDTCMSIYVLIYICIWHTLQLAATEKIHYETLQHTSTHATLQHTSTHAMRICLSCANIPSNHSPSIINNQYWYSTKWEVITQKIPHEMNLETSLSNIFVNFFSNLDKNNMRM